MWLMASVAVHSRNSFVTGSLFLELRSVAQLDREVAMDAPTAPKGREERTFCSNRRRVAVLFPCGLLPCLLIWFALNRPAVALIPTWMGANSHVSIWITARPYLSDRSIPFG